MKARSKILAACALVGLVGGCSDEGNDLLPAGITPAEGFAVVSSNYGSAATVSIVDPATGMVVRDSCISSGTTPPQLSTALSPDVVLPSQPQPGNELVVMDRTNGTLTWLDAKSCAVLRQLAVGVNPHDVVAVSRTKAYVTRYMEDKEKPGEGHDLLVIDPSVPKITKRIDLRPFAGQASEPILPFPDRAILANGKVYVTLNNLSAGYEVGAPGRVLVVDPETDAVSSTIELPTMTNCGSLFRPRDRDALVVGCAGVFKDPMQQERSGAAWIDLDASPPAVKTVTAASIGRPVNAIVAVSAERAFALTFGSKMPAIPDQLWTFGFTGGAPQKMFDAGKEFSLSGLALTKDGARLFVADATAAMPRILVFDAATLSPTPLSSTPSTGTGLPPRQIAWY